MSEAVWIALFTLVAGAALTMVSTLFRKLQDEIKSIAADNKARHEEVMEALHGYVEREPHMEKHLAIDTRLNDHASRIRMLEKACMGKNGEAFGRGKEQVTASGRKL